MIGTIIQKASLGMPFYTPGSGGVIDVKDLTKIMMKAVKSEIYIFASFFSIFGAGGGTKRHNHINSKDRISILPSMTYEYISEDFSFIERTRELEFDRNWGLNNTKKRQQLINFFYA